MTDENRQKALYEHFLKVVHRRLEQAIPGSGERGFVQLSLAELVNLLFLLRGEWGCIGDYMATQRALRALVGDNLFWSDPMKLSSASNGSVN